MIKCNQQVNFQGKTKKENRFIKKTQHIYRKGRLFAFFRGFWATFNRDVFSSGLYFLNFYGIKNWYKKKYNKKFENKMKLLAGGLTGLSTWIIQYPFDTIKTIIATSNLKEKVPRQKEVIRQLYKDGGFRNLYRGGTPSLILSILFTSLTFTFYEFSRSLFFS